MTETSDEALKRKLFKRLKDLEANKPTNLESDEELHQRRRRERMLDEVTLICVLDGIERMACGETEETKWGRKSRDIADSICNGINDFDAKH